MRVMITGATSFIGRNLSEKLKADGVQVTATGRSMSAGKELMRMGVEFRRADLLDLHQTEEAFSSADFLVHCAAKTGDWGNEQDFFEANVMGTRNVINACRVHGITKIIFISTPSIYYTGKDRYDVSESDPLPARQKTPYAKSKLLAESELNAFQKEGNRVIVLRPRAVYGPYDHTFIPRIVHMLESKKISLIDNGRAMIDLTYVGNLIDAINCCFNAPDSSWNEFYNISNGDPISVREWFAEVAEMFDLPFNPGNIPFFAAWTTGLLMEWAGAISRGKKKPMLTRFSAGYLARSLTMNIEKARENLNYSPGISHREGFKLYADWILTRTRKKPEYFYENGRLQGK